MPNANRGDHGFKSSEFEQEYDRPSKSQLKREMTALQKLGEQLVAAPTDRIKRVPLPEELREAILACQKIKSHEGRRRQQQFIGKKMRALDEEEIAAINRMIESWQGKSKADIIAMHLLEKQREKLLAEDAALTELLAQYPQADAQQLRGLIRNARKEQAENKPPKAYRELFQMLKELLSGTLDSTQSEQDADEESDEDTNE